MRKIINHAFSERALRDQEPRIQTHVETLITSLDLIRSKTKGIVDLNEWYNCAAFDIIADAAFGEPFNTLQELTYRPWLSLIGKTWKAITFASAVKSLVPSLYLLRRLIPAGPYLQKEVDKFNLILDRVRKRMSLGTTRTSLLSLVLEHNNEQESMTEQEIISNATLFVAAGTETVTTLLSSLTYLLTRDDRIMQNLILEIRNGFTNEQQMTVQNISQLPYLTACIKEALRVFPPIPEGLPRIVPFEDEEISGHFVPGGTFVQVSNFAASLSPENFVDSTSFVPERWLGIDPRYSEDKKEVSQPFSIGPRNCVGQNLAMAEVRLIVARILWRFDLRCHLKDEWMNQPTYLLWEKKPLLVELISIRKDGTGVLL
ncbi:hypothetical protein MMC17_004839 [Xylographa soralifera]|nr:hypothetical protein [Xylographa soralifera]